MWTLVGIECGSSWHQLSSPVGTSWISNHPQGGVHNDPWQSTQSLFLCGGRDKLQLGRRGAILVDWELTQRKELPLSTADQSQSQAQRPGMHRAQPQRGWKVAPQQALEWAGMIPRRWAMRFASSSSVMDSTAVA